MDSPNSWEEEAQAVINDVKDLVNMIAVSGKLKSDKQRIYLNLLTKENDRYCIELSSSGFRIVGKQHDVHCLDNDQFFDTPYSLLSSISQSYTNVFANTLIDKLNSLSSQE